MACAIAAGAKTDAKGHHDLGSVETVAGVTGGAIGSSAGTVAFAVIADVSGSDCSVANAGTTKADCMTPALLGSKYTPPSTAVTPLPQPGSLEWQLRGEFGIDVVSTKMEMFFDMRIEKVTTNSKPPSDRVAMRQPPIFI